MLEDIEFRDVPVKGIKLVANPDDKEGLRDCYELMKSLAEDKETKLAPVNLKIARMVNTGEDDVLIHPGSILLEMHYMDNCINYTLLCRGDEDEDGIPSSD